jgi:hypothetical protein
MFDLIRWLVARSRRARLDRLITLAGRMDEVLITCHLAPNTRQLLQQKREHLENQIHELLNA